MTPDVLIHGAGPAGLAAALTLRRHAPQLSVAVVAGPPVREKIGETLAPGAQAALRALGVWDAFRAGDPLPAYGTACAWGRAELEANEFIYHPERRGWHIERRGFDAMLAREAAQRGVVFPEVERVAPNALSRENPAVARGAGASAEVFDRSGLGASRSTLSRFVIDATGRAAVIAGKSGARRLADDRLVALSVMFRFSTGRPMQDSYALVEAGELGWWYSSLQPDGRLVVALFTDADLAREYDLKTHVEWMTILCSAGHTFRRCCDAIPEGAPVLRAADSAILDRLVGVDWLATGDAACTFDPLSSQGVVKALREGTLAAYATIDHLAGDAQALPKYEALVRREYREFLAAKRDYYARETRWAQSRFWRRRGAAEAPSTASIAGARVA